MLAELLRAPILAASRSGGVQRAVTAAPVSRGIVSRFVAGDAVDDALRACQQLSADGLLVSLDHLGEDTTDPEQAEAAVRSYLDLLGRLDDAGLTGSVEASVKLTAVGLDLDAGLAEVNALRIGKAAREVGTTITMDMEDASRTAATLRMVHQVRRVIPSTGAVVQAYLRRTESDCRTLAEAGSRVRLCKGAYAEPESVAFTSRSEVDRSYARCLGILMAGPGYPMVATHDPRLIDLTVRLAQRTRRAPTSFEFQMLLGVRPDEQKRLAAAGYRVRVYTPYGDQWYGYLMRRLAERPANLAFFARSLATRR